MKRDPHHLLQNLKRFIKRLCWNPITEKHTVVLQIREGLNPEGRIALAREIRKWRATDRYKVSLKYISSAPGLAVGYRWIFYAGFWAFAVESPDVLFLVKDLETQEPILQGVRHTIPMNYYPTAYHV